MNYGLKNLLSNNTNYIQCMKFILNQ